MRDDACGGLADVDHVLRAAETIVAVTSALLQFPARRFRRDPSLAGLERPRQLLS
jgi:hypothetical protein